MNGHGDAVAEGLEVRIGRVLGLAVRAAATVLAAGIVVHVTGRWPGWKPASI